MRIGTSAKAGVRAAFATAHKMPPRFLIPALLNNYDMTRPTRRPGNAGGRRDSARDYPGIRKDDPHRRDHKGRPFDESERRRLGAIIQEKEHANSKKKAELTELGKRLSKKDSKIQELEQLLAGKNKKISDLQKQTKDDAAVNEQHAQLLEFGTSTLRDQREKRATLEKENEALRQRISDLESKYDDLNDVLLQMEEAKGDELTGLALEAQARQSLDLVKGLQADVAEKDAELQQLKTVLAEKDKKVAAKEKREAELIETMKRQAKERGEFAREQQKLVERTLAENERLAKLAR